jgi:hypothetical protein
LVVHTDRFGGLRWTLLHVKFWQLHRVLGRLESWKIATRFWCMARSSFLPRPRWILCDTVFEAFLGGDVAANLREHGYHAGLQMPLHLVAELRRHAEESYSWRSPGDRERFLIREVHDGRSPLGKAVAVADVDASTCSATARIAGDAVLIDAVQCHFGYNPIHVAMRLYWSPSSKLSDHERRWNGQTIDYHYDIERGNVLYLYFYLGDTDRYSGAHVVVAGSHKAKPLRMKFASTRQPERVVLGRYGADKAVALEGKAGFGFFEDPACFHKVLPPLTSNRLVLQLRYS